MTHLVLAACYDSDSSAWGFLVDFAFSGRRIITARPQMTPPSKTIEAMRFGMLNAISMIFLATVRSRAYDDTAKLPPL